MASLLEMEEKAEPIELVDQPAVIASELLQVKGKDTLTASDYKAAGAYFFGHLLRSKPAILAYAAAVLLLVSLFFVPWGEGEDADNPPVADLPDPTPTDTTPATAVQVANLTAERDAVWDRQPNQDLYAGDRFTLTKGFAEITTSRGAIAIIQAPATIELLNHNALRLHAGKLVGVCETESSKGLLVRTPHMDITDLGTRFGVDADGMQTQVHVLEGEVQAHRPDASAGTEPIVLSAGQSANTSAGVGTIATIEHDADRFAALLPEAIRPAPAPTQGAAGWQIVAVNGQPLDTPGAMKVAKRTKGVPWITAVQRYPEQASRETTFTVQTRFDLPQEVDGASATLALSFDANDRVTQVRVNGRAIEPPTNSKTDGHDGMHLMRIDGPLLATGNTLQIDVVDVSRAGSTKWQLRADWTIKPANDVLETLPGGQTP